MEYYKQMLIKLLLSAVLGALIGFEREHKNRPAGLRTNILVCLGATLVQIISLDIFKNYSNFTNADPARLGAQVISGIGFLGAGTIIREGASIKGLTTAAGLWVVAIIGLAIGQGAYLPGIVTAIVAYVTLTALRGLESRMERKSSYVDIEVLLDNKPGQIGKIGELLGKMNVSIRNIEFRNHEEEKITIFFSLKVPRGTTADSVIKELMGQEGIYAIDRL